MANPNAAEGLTEREEASLAWLENRVAVLHKNQTEIQDLADKAVETTEVALKIMSFIHMGTTVMINHTFKCKSAKNLVVASSCTFAAGYVMSLFLSGMKLHRLNLPRLRLDTKSTNLKNHITRFASTVAQKILAEDAQMPAQPEGAGPIGIRVSLVEDYAHDCPKIGLRYYAIMLGMFGLASAVMIIAVIWATFMNTDYNC